MKILVIGGCHVGNYGIQPSEGFLQQWTNHLSLNGGESIQITCFTLMTYRRLPILLKQYYAAFEEADLILLQMGNYELSHRGSFWDLFLKAKTPEILPKSPPLSQTAPIEPTLPDQLSNVSIYTYPSYRIDWLKNLTKGVGLSFYQNLGGRLPILERLGQSMEQTNELLRPFAAKIVMLTPFPSLNAIDNWLRRASKPLFRLAAKRYGFTLLDVQRAVPTQRSYFLADTYHLNQRGHASMASFLIKSLSIVPIPKDEFQSIMLDAASR